MITVSYCGTTITCTTAMKGDTFIHLLDDNNTPIAIFEGITDFSVFTISGGTWTASDSIDDCHLVVMRRDGTLAKCAKKLCDV